MRVDEVDGKERAVRVSLRAFSPVRASTLIFIILTWYVTLHTLVLQQ